MSNEITNHLYLNLIFDAETGVTFMPTGIPVPPAVVHITLVTVNAQKGEKAGFLSKDEAVAKGNSIYMLLDTPQSPVKKIDTNCDTEYVLTIDGPMPKGKPFDLHFTFQGRHYSHKHHANQQRVAGYTVVYDGATQEISSPDTLAADMPQVLQLNLTTVNLPNSEEACFLAEKDMTPEQLKTSVFALPADEFEVTVNPLQVLLKDLNLHKADFSFDLYVATQSTNGRKRHVIKHDPTVQNHPLGGGG